MVNTRKGLLGQIDDKIINVNEEDISCSSSTTTSKLMEDLTSPSSNNKVKFKKI